MNSSPDLRITLGQSRVLAWHKKGVSPSFAILYLDMAPQRKPLIESLFQQISELSVSSLVALAFGAATLLYIFRRNNRTPRPLNPTGTAESNNGQKKNDGESNVLNRIQHKGFVGSKICAVLEVFFSDNEWKEAGMAKDVLKWYAFSSDVYIMCRIKCPEDKETILAQLKGIEGLARHKVLFCTTNKAYEAFSRQIGPALLITNDSQQAVFLSGVLPYIVLVGNDAVHKGNVASVPSVAFLACDQSS